MAKGKGNSGSEQYSGINAGRKARSSASKRPNPRKTSSAGSDVPF